MSFYAPEFDLFKKKITLANKFWTVSARALYFTCVRQDLSVSTNNFDFVTLALEFDLLFENFKFVNNNGIVSARALAFHMSIFINRTFPWKPRFLTL